MSNDSSPSFNASVLSESFTGVIKSLCERHMTSIIVKFINDLSSKGYDKDEMINVWNNVAPDYVIDNNSSVKTNSANVSGKICCFHYVRAKKDCDKEVSTKSITGKYCSRHLKEENKHTNDSHETENETKKKCEYEFKHGDNEGKQCTSNVSDKSKTRRFCSKHAKTQETEKEPKREKPKTSSKNEEESKETPVFTPRLNRALKVYVDDNSGFIFEKSADKKIYAKLVDGKIVPLNSNDKERLSKMNYLFDSSLITKLHPDIYQEETIDDNEEENEKENDNEED